MASLNHSTAAAYKDHVEIFGEELISRLFYGFPTADIATIHDGVKGTKVLTEIVLGSNLIKRHRTAFDPVSNAATFVPRLLKVVMAKLDLSVAPQDFESSYLGMMRKKGQNPLDFPFEAYILDKVIEKAHTELENAIWGAVETGSPAALDNLNVLFDGFLQIIADAITATDLTVTTTGAISATNIVEKTELVWDSLDPEYKSGKTIALVSINNFVAYQRKYRTDFGKYTNPTNMRETLDFADCTLIGVPGMGSSNRIIVMPQENLHIGLDDVSDYSMFNFDQVKRELHFWMDFKIGCQIGLIEDGVMAVNEQV